MKNREFFPKGWHQFYFVITPAEFELIFSQMNALFVANKKVNEPLQSVPKSEVFKKYKTLHHSILYKKCESNLIEGWFSENIIDDLKKIQVAPVVKADKKRTVFQSLPPAEPMVGLSPFDLTFLEQKNSLSMAYHNPKGVLGMQLSYPKAVAWNYTKLEETDSFAMRKIYDTLTAEIKKLCKKAKVQQGDRLFRPNFWISEQAKNQINSNAYLTENNLQII
ncbi:hypothetical protein [Capnocytophaga sp.]|uniref:hypothetical protein n=1 Tax=Capnocytophaga sp. TaxID=44737 RepID=UPI0026DCF0DB|nr:hypothetical protein [Capnocytophaga sp.]MDO5106439.1 hypothetical protein [Capnocytophaga sp.]